MARRAQRTVVLLRRQRLEVDTFTPEGDAVAEKGRIKAASRKGLHHARQQWPGMIAGAVVTVVFTSSNPFWVQPLHNAYRSTWFGQHALPESQAMGPTQFVVPFGARTQEQMYVVTTTDFGTKTRLPTPSGRGVGSPTLVNGRQTIIYVDSNGDLRTIAADGTGDARLMSPPKGCDQVRHVASIPHDRNHLVLECRTIDGANDDVIRSHLVVVDLYGSVEHSVDTGFARVEDPAVSPDGKTLAYWASNSTKRSVDGGAIELIGLGASAEWQELVPGPAGTWADPAWSPDGKTLLLRRRAADDNDIYSVDVEGRGSPACLVCGPTRDEKAAWSPNGDSFLFVRKESSSWYRLFVSDTSGHVRATGLESLGMLTPVWSYR